MNCKYCRANCTGAKHDREIALCLGYDPPKTNGDNFRAMTDEELARTLFDASWAAWRNSSNGEGIWTEQDWLEWLRQECER